MLFQIGQQYAALEAGHIGPEAIERQMAAQKAKNAANREAAEEGLHGLDDGAGPRPAEGAGAGPQAAAAQEAPRRAGPAKGTSGEFRQIVGQLERVKREGDGMRRRGRRPTSQAEDRPEEAPRGAAMARALRTGATVEEAVGGRAG